jgi:DNA-binding response OmpR family regulator
MDEEKTTRILLAEDDPTLGYLLSEYLAMQSFQVDWAKDGAEAMRLSHSGVYDLTILAVMMPAIDGFTVAELIKNQRPNHPIIFSTAKSMHADVVRGFKSGADDYIKKPVNEEELVARIQAVLRRSANEERTGGDQSFTVFQIGGYIFDSKKYTLVFKEEIKELTELEANLLKLLCEKKGELLNRADVLQKLWGRNDFLARKSMDVFISRLRKYLAKDEKVKIINVHGSGFVLEIK